MAYETIEQHYVLAFAHTVGLAAQQLVSKFLPAVTSQSGLSGEKQSIKDLYGSFELEDNTERFKPMAIKDIGKSRRWFIPHAPDGYVGIDSWDRMRINYDPQTPLIQAALGAIQAAMEDAYHNAYPECCGQAHLECCGSPVQAWSEADQKKARIAIAAM